MSLFPPLKTHCCRLQKTVSFLFCKFCFSTFVSQPGRIRAVGIVGIERKLEEKRKETDKNISEVTLNISSGQLSLSAIRVYSSGWSCD